MVVCSPFGNSATQPLTQPLQTTTFQFQEAKTPAEEVDAIKLLERALELTETALGRDDQAVAELAYRLAQRYDEAGDYDQALKLYERALAIKEKVYGPEDSGVGECLNDLGLLQQDLGNYDEALRLLQRSLRIAEKVYGPEHFEVATTLANIADTYDNKGDYAAALPLAKRALQIREKALGPAHPDVADSLCSLADVYRALGNTAQGLRLAERAVDVAEKALGPEDALVSECLVTLADVQKDRGNFKQAIPLYKRALEINEKTSGADHPDVFRDLNSLAQTWTLEGDLRQGISTLADLGTRQRHYLARHFQTSSWKVASRVADLFRPSSEMLQTLCATRITTNADWITSAAAENSALNKAFWEEVQAAHAALEANQQVRVAELHSQYRLLQSQLTRLPQNELDQDKRDNKRRELEAKLDQVTAELAERVGAVARRVLDQNVTLSDIARHLPAGATLVDLIQYRRYDFSAKTNEWGEQRYAAYLTYPMAQDSTNVSVERVELGEVAPIDEAIQVISQRMSAGQYAAADLAPALRRASELVYGPMARHLANTSHLIICPDGQLSRLPFEMLSVPDDAAGPHGEQFLVEEKAISYVGCGREIAQSERGPPPAGGPDSANATNSSIGKSLVMGNPDFDFDLTNLHPSTTPSQDPGGAPSLFSLSRDYKGLNFQPLPGAEAEARCVASLLGEGTTLRLRSDAREAELKAAVSPRLLLLATHGFFLSDQEAKRTNGISGGWSLAHGIARQKNPEQDWENPLVRCGLALAGANRALQVTNALAENGLLTGMDACLLNLQGTELVILSACNSGAGEVKIGEGVMSLRRAFQIAGAQAVLASQWQVSDKATEELITAFVKLWRSGKSRAQALREAQLSLLRSHEFSNPYFWAAFTLTGQWN